ncbi:hypothetical protein MSG28_009809 [Choristoneura fumiferana]|uniref:Uncharacterized protein n=1 Tax=Choristoneura fumiferana TaxID=7141 RepID=A0ACC0JCQ9_CHOFU|nr:hypothetical protein MSG28_009809 [Choristoneura fumiferana]
MSAIFITSRGVLLKGSVGNASSSDEELEQWEQIFMMRDENGNSYNDKRKKKSIWCRPSCIPVSIVIVLIVLVVLVPLLDQPNLAQVRSLNFSKLLGNGVLHTKFWIVYWSLGAPDAVVPDSWPANLSTAINMDHPINISDKYHSFGAYLTKRFRVPSTPDQDKIPFARVNHNKYMVTDRTAYIGTSNWSGDYFVDTAGVAFVMQENHGSNVTQDIRKELQDVFYRDWNSPYALPLRSWNL